MTGSESRNLPDDLTPEVGGAGAATWALALLGLAALAAAVAARVAAPEALYDRYLILVAVGAGIAAAAVGRRWSRIVPGIAATGALALLSMYAIAVLAVPPPHAGLKALLARAFPPEPKLVYVEGGNGVASLWSEASGWRSAPSPSAFEATRGDVRLRIERIGGLGEQVELGDYADLALSDIVDQGEVVACDAEGPGAYGDRQTAWRSFAAYDHETDQSPSFGVYVVYVDGDTVYGARVDAPTREGILEAAPATREVLAIATSDPAEKSLLRRRAGLDSVSHASVATNPGARSSASPQGQDLRFGRQSPGVRPKPYGEPDSVRAPPDPLSRTVRRPTRLPEEGPMSDEQALCPNCGSRCIPAPTRTLQLAVTRNYVCGECGAEWRHDWKPYLATAAFFGGGAVALGAGGLAVWTFLAADSDAFGWQAWRTIGIGLAVATISAVFARRGWRFLRSSPTWIVVERPGLTVDGNSSAEAQPVQATRRWLSRWKGLAEGAASLGFATLIALFGTETPRKPFGQGNPPLPQGPSRVVQESLRPKAGIPPRIDPSASGADAEPFPEDVQRKIDEWLKRSSTSSEESSAWAERYYDRSWSQASE